MWLVRNNASFVARSLRLEDGSTQFTSSLADFATVVSARNAIGFDSLGRLFLVTVDGKTWTSRGMNLADFAEFLLGLGIVNAINLDGGGSATAAENGTVVSMPSDPCPEPYEQFSCERPITTINWCVQPFFPPALYSSIFSIYQESAAERSAPPVVVITIEEPADLSAVSWPYVALTVGTVAASLMLVARWRWRRRDIPTVISV